MLTIAPERRSSCDARHAGAKEAAFQVRIDDDIPLAFWYFRRAPDLNSRVIDESIESAKRRKDFLNIASTVVGISNVSVNGNGTSSLIFQLAGEIVGGNWIDFVIDGDRRILPEQGRDTMIFVPCRNSLR